MGFQKDAGCGGKGGTEIKISDPSSVSFCGFASSALRGQNFFMLRLDLGETMRWNGPHRVVSWAIEPKINAVS